MKIFLDTNVLIASFVSNGLCHELLEHCVLNRHLYTSEFVLDEFKEKLEIKFKVSSDVAADAVDLIREQAEITDEATLDGVISRDPDDDHILAAATKAECELIITGDKDLLVFLQYEGIPIITRREFFDAEISEYQN